MAGESSYRWTPTRACALAALPAFWGESATVQPLVDRVSYSMLSENSLGPNASLVLIWLVTRWGTVVGVVMVGNG